MKVEDIEKEVSIFYLGRVSGIEGPLLNIIKLKNKKLYFERIIENKDNSEGKDYIHLFKEITIDNIKNIFSEDNLKKYSKGPLLSKITLNKWDKKYFYNSKTEQFIEMKKEDFIKLKNFIKETEYENDYPLFSILNWSFDKVKNETILNYILNKLDLK